MLKIALCDDNPRAIKQYAELISQISKKHQINMEISCFDNGEILLFHYSDVLKETDIIYLDIMMGKTDGMETARRLRECGCKAQIVFLPEWTGCRHFTVGLAVCSSLIPFVGYLQ